MRRTSDTDTVTGGAGAAREDTLPNRVNTAPSSPPRGYAICHRSFGFASSLTTAIHIVQRNYSRLSTARTTPTLPFRRCPEGLSSSGESLLQCSDRKHEIGSLCRLRTVTAAALRLSAPSSSVLQMKETSRPSRVESDMPSPQRSTPSQPTRASTPPDRTCPQQARYRSSIVASSPALIPVLTVSILANLFPLLRAHLDHHGAPIFCGPFEFRLVPIHSNSSPLSVLTVRTF